MIDVCVFVASIVVFQQQWWGLQHNLPVAKACMVALPHMGGVKAPQACIAECVHVFKGLLCVCVMLQLSCGHVPLRALLTECVCVGECLGTCVMQSQCPPVSLSLSPLTKGCVYCVRLAMVCYCHSPSASGSELHFVQSNIQGC